MTCNWLVRAAALLFIFITKLFSFFFGGAYIRAAVLDYQSRVVERVIIIICTRWDCFGLIRKRSCLPARPPARPSSRLMTRLHRIERRVTIVITHCLVCCYGDDFDVTLAMLYIHTHTHTHTHWIVDILHWMDVSRWPPRQIPSFTQHCSSPAGLVIDTNTRTRSALRVIFFGLFRTAVPLFNIFF